jgi:hypothetical protein
MTPLSIPRLGILIVVVATTGLACSVRQPGPDAVVLAAFDAYAKADSAKVADLMLDTYAHVLPSMGRGAADRLGALLHG